MGNRIRSKRTSSKRRLFIITGLTWLACVVIGIIFQTGLVNVPYINPGDINIIIGSVAVVCYFIFVIALIRAHLRSRKQSSILKYYWYWAIIMTLVFVIKAFIAYNDNYTNSIVENTYSIE